jgi:iron(III) transport system substrate-binding protein
MLLRTRDRQAVATSPVRSRAGNGVGAMIRNDSHNPSLARRRPPHCRRRARPVGLAAFVAIAGMATAEAQTRLVVFSTLELDQLEPYRQAFEADHPDIKITWQRDATGVVTARIVAEKNNPSADAVWGLAVTSMILLDREGILLPYAPKELDRIKPNFRDGKNPPSWVGIDGWASALCYNPIEGAKLNLSRPTSWFDLLDVRFKDRIVMPHPASSGTGFFTVSAWIQMFGEARAWDYMDKLDRNIAVYVHSGTQPCRMAGTGEFPIGISAETSVANVKKTGAPIEALIMKEGGGWDMDATAIIKGTKNLEAAKRLADWAASRRANELYSQHLGIVAMAGLTTSNPHYPPGVEASLIKNDFVWAADNRARILAEWQKRYEGKAAKRN